MNRITSITYASGESIRYTYDEVGNLLKVDTTLDCGAVLSHASGPFPAAGGSGVVTVTLPVDCQWQAVSNHAWIQVTSAAQGLGSGEVTFTVAPNPGAASRNGSLAIAGLSFAVTQAPQVGFQPDADGNGLVNLDDVSLAVAQFLQASGGLALDCNGDGHFGVADLICHYNLVDPISNPTVVQSSLLDINSNGQVDPLTDGLVIVRHLFGFSGPSLVGVVPDGANRISPQSQKNYLTAFHAIFDVDLDGEASSLKDGLLLVRFFFGFRGQALVQDISLAGSPRDSAAAIETYLQTLSQP